MDYFSIILYRTLNDYVENINGVNTLIRLEGKIYNNWGLWLSLGLSSPDKIKEIPSDFNMFDKIDLNKYNIENISKSKQYSSSAFLFMLGLSYRYKHKNWLYTPYLGYGSRNFTPNNLSYTLTEIGTDLSYDIQYKWLDPESGEYKKFHYLYLQFKTERNIYKKMNIVLGLSLRHYLTRPDFTATMANHHDRTIINQIQEKGNRLTTIGISAGISF